MPVDSGGNVSRPASPTPVTGQGADAPQVNVPLDDIYAILNMLVFRDGRKALTGNLPMNGYRVTGAANGVDPQDLVPLVQVQALISAVSGSVTGELKLMTGTPVPAGYLRANGQSVLRATYPALWAYAQASENLAATQEAKTNGQYGPGDGSTTFTLPKIVDFVRGLDTGRTIGSSQADELKGHEHSLTMDPVPDHVHPYQRPTPTGSGFDYGGGSIGRQLLQFSTSPAGGHTPTGKADATGGAETRPKNIAYPYVIKT